jgi:hypothetical protein
MTATRGAKESVMRWTGKEIVVGLALVAVGCGEVEPFGMGTLEVEWSAAPLGCEAAEVETVLVTLGNDRNSYSASLPCRAARGMLTGVVPGTYVLVLEGLDENGQTIFGAPEREVFVRPDEPTVVPIQDLSALPSKVKVRWYFENQRVCGGNGVSEVELTVYDAAFYEVSRVRVECDEGTAHAGGLQPGEVWVRLRAEGEAGRYEGISDAVLKRGSETMLDIGLFEVLLNE